MILTAQRARELLAYDARVGTLIWRLRPANAAWNARHAGKIAGAPYRDGYRCVGIDGRTYAVHRVIWLITKGYWPNGDIDHINGDRADNRLCNLRDVTRSQNLRNTRLRDSNRSGVPGVYWNRNAKKWHAQITAGGKTRYLGIFDSLDDAASVRKRAEAENGYHPNHGRVAA